jgi:peptidoglycan/xylan/chitin deacetylase (PgdA/CDA1 family)
MTVWSAVRAAKRGTLNTLNGAGVFRLVRDSAWRQRRLLILGYHGISTADEHQWDPELYVHPDLLRARFETLRRHNCSVLPLAAAVDHLAAGTLPPRSVVITFDDGMYDFYTQAFPIAQEFGFPITVYLTTYYTEFNRPIFALICSYMFWKAQGTVVEGTSLVGRPVTWDLRTAGGRAEALRSVRDHAEQAHLSGPDKDLFAQSLAHLLGVDYGALVRQRILQLMNRREISDLAGAGIDFQLHTHRHRTPRDRQLFRREIDDNRSRIESATHRPAAHFCYPSGVVRPELPGWLRENQVRTATTCNPGLASPQTDPFWLPRLMDGTDLAPIFFEAWVTGPATWLPRKQHYTPDTD